MNYGLIICAGKQSRFRSDIPKALVKLNNTTLLTENIKTMIPYCDKIIVVCSVEKQQYFTKDILLNAELFPIYSGKGSGDAVWQIINKLNITDIDKCYILWGDCLQRDSVFKALQQNYKGITLIPCKKEKNPYVQVKQIQNNRLNILFSKFNEPVCEGYHDLSVFCCNAKDLHKHINIFHDKITDLDGNYCHKHGNEMEFLDIFNETNIKAKILEFEKFEEFAFNTVEQFEDLLAKLKK